MTPFGKWVKTFAEKVVGKFYEGPEPPTRIAKMVHDFANLHPHATRGDWVAFTSEIAQECYRAGFVRGYEHIERDMEGIRPDIPPEAFADLMDPDWRWGDAVELHHDPDAPVQYSFSEEEVTRHETLTVNAYAQEDPLLRGARRR